MINQKLSDIAQRLWDLNENKLTRNVEYQMSLQEKVTNRNRANQDDNNDDDDDENEQRVRSNVLDPLISYIDIRNLLSRPTFRTFVKLFDNYTPETDQAEVETEGEDREEKAFLNACMRTPLMQEAHQFLVSQGKAPHDEQEFRDFLEDLWFDFYSRSQSEKVEDSSAFEHVFIGERKKNQKVLGCHNWLDYFYLQRLGQIDYHGYIPSKTNYDENSETTDPGMVAIRFSMDGVLKPMGGFMVGVSPEFELALYTIIFLCGGSKTRVQFANIDVTFECFKMERNGKKVIATLFPSM